LPKVVCNSSPLIHLSKAGRLSLLRDFFQEKLVPREVWTESVENSGGAKDAKEEIEEADWIQTIGWRLSGSTSGRCPKGSGSYDPFGGGFLIKIYFIF